MGQGRYKQITNYIALEDSKHRVDISIGVTLKYGFCGLHVIAKCSIDPSVGMVLALSPLYKDNKQKLKLLPLQSFLAMCGFNINQQMNVVVSTFRQVADVMGNANFIPSPEDNPTVYTCDMPDKIAKKFEF